MRYLLRIVEGVLLVLLVAISVKNSHSVEFKLFLGVKWDAPLIVFLLVFFVIGVVTGLSATLTYYIRMRREVSQLKKQLRQSASSKVVSDPSDAIAR